MASNPSLVVQDPLTQDYLRTRALSEALAAPLSDADATLQPNPDASPSKWHLAHISWFFETFVLRDHVPGYRLFDADWPFLFNSYYDGEGARHARHRRGMISRPSLDQILDYRRHVDRSMAAAIPDLPAAARDLVTLGLAHEQQHQELFVTDILAAFAENPLAPAYTHRHPRAGGDPASASARLDPRLRGDDAEELTDTKWINGRAGIVDIGACETGFAFDAERPRHQALLGPHKLASRPVTNGEWLRFIADGGYASPGPWLSDGWAWAAREAIEAPLYWRRDGDGWRRFGLDGSQDIDLDAPVSHISFYEADAYARWAGGRLPTEFEWEAAAAGLDPCGGNQLDNAGAIMPRAAAPSPGQGLRQMFGDVWEWTASAFLPYPGFAPADGTVGEYNGKFMSGQMVLRGGSCATPRGHLRASYRNFFPPHARWQFSGVRLARNA